MSTLGVTYRATTGKRNQVLQDFRTCLYCAAQLTSVVFCIFCCYCSVPCFLASCKAVLMSWHSTTSCSPFTATSKVPLTSDNSLPRSKIKGRFNSSLPIPQVMKSYRQQQFCSTAALHCTCNSTWLDFRSHQKPNRPSPDAKALYQIMFSSEPKT